MRGQKGGRETRQEAAMPKLLGVDEKGLTWGFFERRDSEMRRWTGCSEDVQTPHEDLWHWGGETWGDGIVDMRAWGPPSKMSVP